ncbi:hypothetical protein SLE2022_094900 [Rubroshorea leprosula]
MHALMDGLKDSSFYRSLNKREPTSLNDLLRRAEGYIRAEERAVVKEAQETPNSEEGRKRKIEKDIDSRNTKDRKQTRYNLRDRHSQTQREFVGYTTLTPLNTSRTEVFNVAKKTEKLQWPARMASNPTRRDQTRFCAFHGEHGHDTEECRQLKIEIERLIRRGALRQFVKTNDGSRNRKDQHKKPGEKEKEEEQPLEVVGTINIVSLPS